MWLKIISFFTMISTFLGASLGFPAKNAEFLIDTPAAVFESGDDMYTVMWTTTQKGTGYVTYTFEGRDYTVYDQIGGNIRTDDTVHSVRVPKAHLAHNTYTVHSQYVAYKFAYFAEKGKTVNGNPVAFQGYTQGNTVRMLALSDIHGEIENVQKAVSHFTEAPDLIILNGDIVSTMEYKTDFIKIIQFAGTLSGGQIPVAYVRGNHEPRGEFAAQMIPYFKTSTGNLYYTFSYGPVWCLCADAGEDKPDDNEEYSGCVDFTAYTAEETKWLNALDVETAAADAQYRICLVHRPELEDVYGNNWLTVMEDKGIEAVISGHWHQLIAHFFDAETPFHRIVEGGKSTESTYIASLFTFEGGQMTMKSVDVSGNIMAEKIYEMPKSSVTA